MSRPSAAPELLDQIYSSALEPDAWPAALEAIAAAFDAEAGLVYLPGHALDPTDFARDYIGWNAPDFDLCARMSAESGRWAIRSGILRCGSQSRSVAALSP